MTFSWRKPPNVWELATANSRYKHHRLKVRTAKHAIDCNPPEARPHVHLKKKKLLAEETRQVEIIKENLRLLNTTAKIASSRHMAVGNEDGRPLELRWNEPSSAKSESGAKPARNIASGYQFSRLFSKRHNKVRPVTTR